MQAPHGGDGPQPCLPGIAGRKDLCSPRASAFTLLGLDSYCAVVPDNLRAREIRHFVAHRLMSCLASVETPDWSWFEEGLTYDNACLPQALMLAGMATQTPDYVDAGLRSLRWLMTQQTAPTGHFRPVGTAGFGELRQSPRPFDQQPVEATATIAACLTAWRADGDAEWKTIATNVFAWFFGRNDLSVALVDPEPAVAGMDCTPTAPTKIAGASRSCPISSALLTFVSLHASMSA